MKRILLISILASMMVLPLLVGAQSQTVPANLDVIKVLERLVDWLFTILLIIAAIAIVVAGYYFVTATGDPERVAKARQFVIFALVGVAVALAARGLVLLVKTIVIG